MSFKSLSPVAVVTMMTVSPTSMVSLPRGVMIRPFRLIQATKRFGFRDNFSKEIPMIDGSFQCLCLIRHDFIQSFYIAS